MQNLFVRPIVRFVLATTLVVVLGVTASAQFSTSPPSTRLRRTTLGFRNATNPMIVQTVPEIGVNEKEVEIGDFDNDGDPDVVMAVARSDFTERRNKLYRNDPGPGGTRVYREVSGAPIIPGFTVLDVSRNAFFRDYDNDGWLDIVIVNDANNGNPQGVTRFYANKHPNGVFSDFVDETSRLNGAGGAACGAVSADLNNDSQYDLYLGNYPFNSQDTMYFNNGAGIFTNVTANNVPTESDYTVDIGVGDMNGDGKRDLLVTSMFAQSYVYYNDLPNMGSSGVGDFKYTGGQAAFPSSNIEGAMEAADFNGDGKLDIYYSNRAGFNDWILQNDGNDTAGKATWITYVVPGSVSVTESRKATVADLNRDGRPDLIVMGEGRRPHILRNTSVNGQTSFVDWTPASEFPTGSTLAGWHAAAFDADADGTTDILVGGMNNDHMFVYESPPEYKESVLAGTLPVFYNGKPITVLGNAVHGEIDSYAASLPANADVSIVLRTLSDDVALQVRNAAGNVIGGSDRGAAGIEEAMMFVAPAGGITIDVQMSTKHAGIRNYVLEILARD